MKRIKIINIIAAFILIFGCFIQRCDAASKDFSSYNEYGGGYAATGQIQGASFTTQIYDASNGLPTSDAMFVMGDKKGYVWIGGYSGVIRYDGSVFERLDTSNGLTSARAFFEDRKGRIWVGTNDNGVVLIDGEKRVQFTYKEGLPSSSIRIFEEDNKGNIIIGTTSGVCYIDPYYNVHIIDDSRINDERVLKLDRDVTGRIYGHTSNGKIFAIDNCEVTKVYDSAELGLTKITTIMADPTRAGKVYLGASGNYLYYGDFGSRATKMVKIYVAPMNEIHWISYDCGRVWLTSTRAIGYLAGNKSFRIIEKTPMDSGIEMMTSDYQGNLWFASSTQGVMKVVTSNFIDVTSELGLSNQVVNATCMHDGNLYIGTDTGLKLINKDGRLVENKLTLHFGDDRIRCIEEDKYGNLWVGSYTGDKGVACFSKKGIITSYTTKNGMPSNQIRCITPSKNGGVLVGTNGGLAVIHDGVVVQTVGAKDGLKNTVFMTVTEINEGYILVGTDGDGIYAIEKDHVEKIGRENGLTSDVIMRLVKDEERQVLWIITSNSIQYITNGISANKISSFPYNNNYDMFFDEHGNAWILSSYGIYIVNAEEMHNDAITDYKQITIANGLPYAITGNSFSDMDDEGNLYISGRSGVIKVNVNNYSEQEEPVLMEVKSIYCDNEKVSQDENGVYQIPASKGRIQISAAVLDYTLLNPLVRMYLEGGPDEGVTAYRNSLSPLEYTNLAYGNYVLHIQILENGTNRVIQDEAFDIKKAPGLFELLIVRMMLIALLVIVAGLFVWRIMGNTVIRKQYNEIRLAKEEAERANSAKTRFLANISHEIRTPINTIMGMNEMIMREDASNVPKGYFMSMMSYAFDIRNASESLLSLINDLLDMSKIEAGKMHLVDMEYDTQEMLRSIVSMIRVRSNEKGLSFDVVIDEILPKRLYGDVGKIKQIVLNLLTNALKYTKVGGFALFVSMDERQDKTAFIRFSVKDTGIGVKEEDMEKLFSAYERLDEEKNSAIQGTGLGLDISRRFAELMGGRLWCESVYGEGSEFIFTVNQTIVDQTPLGVFIEHEDTSSKGPYVPRFIAPDADILVVDDTPMNLSVIKGLLKATKVFVTTAESGPDAIDKIKDNHFDVVLLDHMMPGMDGVETLEIIREFMPDLPVYALTANAVAGEEFYKSKGFNGYLSKPIDVETLEKTIMKHIPENKMEKPTIYDAVEEITEIPEEKKWINEVEGINADEGIANSGGISNYIFSLELFYDTIDENAKILKDSYDEGNIRLFTIKVHALKSSARIIGAAHLSEICAKLEEAGNKQDIDYIQSNIDILFTEYATYKDKLARLKQKNNTEKSKGMISPDMLKDAYEALSDFIPQMDYDSVEMILSSLSEYTLPEEDAKLMDKLDDLLKHFDWEQMETLIRKA